MYHQRLGSSASPNLQVKLYVWAFITTFLETALVGVSALLTKPYKSKCFMFFQYVHIPIWCIYIGSLKFIAKRSGEPETVVWMRSGTQGNKWRFADLTFNSDKPIQVLWILFNLFVVGWWQVFSLSHISLKKQAFHLLYCLNLMEDTQMTIFFLLFACEGLLDFYLKLINYRFFLIM